MIIYVGEELKGGFVREVASGIEESVRFIPPRPHIRDVEYDMLEALQQEGGCTAAVYETDQFTDEAGVIVEGVMKFHKTSGAEVVLVTPSIARTNLIVAEAYDKGLRNFIFQGGSMSDKKEQLLKCLVGDYGKNGREELAEIEKAKEKKEKRQRAFRTIGVMGALRRIGTTTQAIQIVKYLQSMGYKACYVEMNDVLYRNNQFARFAPPEVSYVTMSMLTFEYGFLDEEIGLVNIEGIDMFYLRDRLPEILERKYDFYVYDYGDYLQKDFNKASFLKDDVQIIVAGAGIGEVDTALEILQNVSYLRADLVFTHVALADREEVTEVMGDFGAGERTYYAEETPNPYVLSNPGLYQSLLGLEIKEGTKETVVKKKRRLFGKRRE